MAASRVLRQVEIALFVIGLSLLGVALGATAQRKNFQAEQEEAFERVMAASQMAQAETAPDSVLSPSETAEAVGETSNPVTPVKPEDSIEPSDKEAAVPAVPESPVVEDVSKKASPLVASPADALDPDLLGRLVIPRLNFSAFVLEGEDESTLERAVGFLPGTARPGEGGNTGLAAHRDTFFRPLEGVQVDDRIRLEIPPHTYEYRVDSLRVVEPSEVSVLDFTGTEELTLVTCYPFRYIGPAPNRFIVKATRVQENENGAHE